MAKIPKLIHCFWFGNDSYSQLNLQCIESWKKNLPDYEIKVWTKKDFNISINKYTKKAYQLQKYAFITDYARLYVLYNYGGIYLDHDMEVLQNIDGFLSQECFLGFESHTLIGASIIGAKKHNPFIKKCLDEYENLAHFEILPKLMTYVYKKYYSTTKFNSNKKISRRNFTIYPIDYFYPLPYGKSYSSNMITKNSHCIHWWEKSWGKNKKINKLSSKISYILYMKTPNLYYFLKKLQFQIQYKTKI